MNDIEKQHTHIVHVTNINKKMRGYSSELFCFDEFKLLLFLYIKCFAI